MSLEVVVTRAREPSDRPPLVFVHGAWHGAWCWTTNFTGWFADRGYTSYAVDLSGHGASRGSLRRSRIAHYVADVRRVTHHIEGDPILVGHSMGGFVVQHYLARYRARAGVLVAPVPAHGAIGATARVAARHPAAFLRANGRLRLGPIVDDPERARHLLFGPHLDEDTAMAYSRRVQDESYLAYIEMLADLPRPSRVKDPVLVVAGEHDALFSPSEMHRTAAAYGAEVEVFPDSGHNMMLDHGWENVANHIAEWLEGR